MKNLIKKKAKILRLKVTAYVFLYIYILKYFISGCFSLDFTEHNKFVIHEDIQIQMKMGLVPSSQKKNQSYFPVKITKKTKRKLLKWTF